MRNSTMEPPPAWSMPEALEQLAIGGDEKLVAEILDDFESDAGARTGLLASALARQDAPAVRIQAHALKGSAAQVGAARLAAACLKMEQQAAAGSLTNTSALLGDIEQQLADVLRAMAAYRQRKNE